jgi:hypothetical protein
LTPTITRTPTPTSALSGPRVSFAGAISQDGCQYCCQFSCQQTPTPTPIIENGRQVFIQTVGQFLFVVEGQRGPTNLNPGLNVNPSGSDRGDLQILVSRSTGAVDEPGFGSTAICDMGPPPLPFGGVPGVNPPVFLPGDAITHAIQDLECRFTAVPLNSVSGACTRKSNGDFAFINSQTRTQYCYQVPMTGAFQVGDTLVSVQLRDIGGNIGPTKEFIIRVLP